MTEDLEKAARQQREGLELAAKGESSLHRMHMIEEKVPSVKLTSRLFCQAATADIIFPVALGLFSTVTRHQSSVLKLFVAKVSPV